MSRKLIFVLVIFMSLALLGLIILQSLWLSNAFRVKENHFDQLVHKALAEASSNIQRNETMNYIFNEFNPNVNNSGSNLPQQNFNFDTIIHYNLDSTMQLSHDIKISHSSDNGNVTTNISISGSHSIVGRNDIFNDSVIQRKISNRKDLVNQIVTRMFSLNPEIENRVTPEIIERTFKKSLEDNGINLRFEFAVTKWNDLIALKSDKFDAKKSVQLYKIRLFPDDFFDNTNFLSIYFPNRRNFIIRSLSFMVVSSSLLTIFLLFTFAFTLYVIFRQKRLTDMKSDFVSNMTHELKTPISTISLASQMLSDKSIPIAEKNIDRISDIVSEETRRLSTQVEKVLQMAKFDQGELKLKFKEVHLHELIESVISNFMLQVESKEGILIPSLHAENDLVNADPVHMLNVISNLVDNAIKYTIRTPEIFIETQSEGNQIYLKVRDNGIGISSSNQRRVFDKFYRISTGNIHNVKGFGLGLSYVKKIVEEHQGTIKIDSEIDVGSVFTICLPLIK